jgi:hypothetical protein
MTEHSEQAMVIEWAKRHEMQYPELQWLFSSLNGIFIPGPRQMVYKIINHMKAEGMKKGIADLCLPVARHDYHGLFIEMKRTTGGNIRDEQSDFLEFVATQGYYGTVCHGYNEAVETLEWYLSERDNP